MYKQVMLAGAMVCLVGVGDAIAGCAAPSVQVLSAATTGFATAIVTFVDNNGAGQTEIVDSRVLTRGGSNATNTAVATAFRTGVAPSGQSFSGAYATWQVSADQTGLAATQVRYVSTVSGTVPAIPVTAGDNDPSQVTTQGPAVSSLSTLLTNNTVCVGAPGNWQNQEWHQSGGNLWDWKLGNGHLAPSGTLDPTKQLGTWAISGTGTGTIVTYNYTAFAPAGPFPFSLWKNGDGTYSFCTGATQVVVAKIYQNEISCQAGGTQL